VIYQFGGFELDPERYVLLRGGTPIEVEPKCLRGPAPKGVSRQRWRAFDFGSPLAIGAASQPLPLAETVRAAGPPAIGKAASVGVGPPAGIARRAHPVGGSAVDPARTGHRMARPRPRRTARRHRKEPQMKTHTRATKPAWVLAVALALLGTTSGAAQDGALVLRPEGRALAARAGDTAGCAIEPHDGSFESAVGFQPSQNAVNFAQRFELPPIAEGSEWYLDDVCLTLTRTGSAGESSFTFAVFRDEGGLPGGVLAFRSVTAELPVFPGSTVCAGDFALSLLGLDAIHVGLAYDPQQANVFLMMDESPSTPAEVVSVRSSATGPEDLSVWSPATTIRPGIRASGVGVTLFASTRQWVTTPLPAPRSAGLESSGATALGRSSDESRLIGASWLRDRHQINAFAVYTGRSPSEQRFASITGDTEGPGEPSWEAQELQNLPWTSLVSLGNVLPALGEGNQAWFTVVDGNFDMFGVTKLGDQFDFVDFGQPADDYGSAKGVNGKDGRLHVAAFNRTKGEVERWSTITDQAALGGALLADLELSGTHGDGRAVRGGQGAIGQRIWTVKGVDGDFVCVGWSGVPTGGGPGVFDYIVNCGGEDRTIVSGLPFVNFAREGVVLLGPGLVSTDLSKAAAEGSVPVPDSWSEVHVIYQGQNGNISDTCFEFNDGEIGALSTAFLAQGAANRSSLIDAKLDKHHLKLAYLNLPGDAVMGATFTVKSGCVIEKVQESVSLPWSADGQVPLPIPAGSTLEEDIRDVRASAERTYSSNWLYESGSLGAPLGAPGVQEATARSERGAVTRRAAERLPGLLAPRADEPFAPLALAEQLAPRPCLGGAGSHCLNDDRFEVTVDWRTQQGDEGIGRRVDLTDDSGLFYFFNEDNLELIAKVLDACASPFQSFWVFTAGLTDVEYVMEIFDSQTGRRRHYVNPLKTAAQPVQDTAAFKPCGGLAAGSLLIGAHSEGMASDVDWIRAGPAAGRVSAADGASEESWALPGWARDALRSRRGDARQGAALRRSGAAGTLSPRAGDCTPGPTTLCLGNGRFEVEAEWVTESGSSGPGRSIELTDDTGAFWFFDSENVEILIKVLDACSTEFDSFWVFAAGPAGAAALGQFRLTCGGHRCARSDALSAIERAGWTRELSRKHTSTRDRSSAGQRVVGCLEIREVSPWRPRPGVRLIAKRRREAAFREERRAVTFPELLARRDEGVDEEPVGGAQPLPHFLGGGVEVWRGRALGVHGAIERRRHADPLDAQRTGAFGLMPLTRLPLDLVHHLADPIAVLLATQVPPGRDLAEHE
jgi:hypothetical protein